MTNHVKKKTNKFAARLWMVDGKEYTVQELSKKLRMTAPGVHNRLMAAPEQVLNADYWKPANGHKNKHARRYPSVEEMRFCDPVYYDFCFPIQDSDVTDIYEHH